MSSIVNKKIVLEEVSLLLPTPFIVQAQFVLLYSIIFKTCLEHHDAQCLK